MSEISKVIQNPELEIIKPKLVVSEDNPFELASDALVSSCEDSSMCIPIRKLNDRIPLKIIPRRSKLLRDDLNENSRGGSTSSILAAKERRVNRDSSQIHHS